MKERFYRIKIPDNSHPLVREVFEIANDERIGLLDLAERAGLSKNTLQDWRTRSMPTVAKLNAVGNVLGWELTWRRRQD